MPPKKKRKRRKRKGHYHRGVHISPFAGECKYRSGWEQKFCVYLDTLVGIKTWSYEKLVIDYLSNKRTGKMRKYYPDFFVEYEDGRRVVYEIKPRRKLEQATVVKKIEAAIRWCMMNGAMFEVLTEVQLKQLGLL